MATTFDVPGGTVTMLTSRDELGAGKMREVELVAARVGKKVEAAARAAHVYCEGDLVVDNSEEKDDAGEPVFDGPDVDLTENELRLMGRLNDAIAWALLESWTLDRPLPETPKQLLDLPYTVFSELRQKAAELNAAMGDGGFTVDAVEDRRSPTGDSGASVERLSPATGKTSTRRPRRASANTATNG